MKFRNFETLYLYVFPKKPHFQLFLQVWSTFLRLVCRMILTFYDCNQMSLGYLLDTYDLRFGHVINFLETFEKSFSSRNMRFQQNIPNPFRTSFFKISIFFHFSWHIIWLVCRVVTILHQNKYLGWVNLSRDLHFYKGLKILSKAFVKNISAQELRKKWRWQWQS